MKKILFSFLLFSLLLSMQLNANIIHNNVYNAQKQGLKEAKIIVFIIASSSCHFCHKLLNDISNHHALMQLLKEYYAVAVIDLDDPSAKIPSDLIFNGKTPTTYIITPTGNVIGQPLEGAVSANYLYELLKNIQDFKKEQLGF